MEIISFDPEKAEDELCFKLFEHSDLIKKETDPDDPIPDRNWRLLMLRQKNPEIEVHRWLAMEEDKVVGDAQTVIVSKEAPNYETDKHIMWMSVRTSPDYRHRGIGTELLKHCIKNAEGYPEVKKVMGGAHHELGKKFAEKLGGKTSMSGSENRLRIEEIDWNLMDSWIADGEKLGAAEGVKIRYFEKVPDDIIEAYTKIYSETMNQQPLGDYDGEIKVTPKSLREDEKRREEQGTLNQTMITVEKDGTISGLTEIFSNSQVPHKAFQGLTGVDQRYRGRGLGKWLKASLLKDFFDRYPDVKYITTGNATTNAPMLSINTRMGFKPFLTGNEYTFNFQNLKDQVK